MTPATRILIERLTALAAEGKSYQEAADALGATYNRVVGCATRHGIPLQRLKKGRQRIEPGDREEKMRSLFLEGKTFSEIGGAFGFSGAHVQRLLKAAHGISGADGGKALQARMGRERLATSRAAYAMQHFDLPYEEYRRVLKLPGKPTRRFAYQRSGASRRGVGWELTFSQWWAIWQESGHWEHRGPGQGYVMCRRGDIGPYAVGNVFIAPSIVNCSDKPTKLANLPIGVTASRKKFLAQRMIDGQRYRLGVYETPEMAHAAYLSLGPIGRAA